MKVSGYGFWILFFVSCTAFMFLSLSSSRTGPSIPDVIYNNHDGSMAMASTDRNLKEINGFDPGADEKELGDVSVDDYHPIDPVPSSKASIKTGPIEHGRPLIPYIPRPSPPGHSVNG
ncbi:hypothetical protein CFOL_v3_13985 [Cephalotus follicularis]|uniref:Uncharacterized protein n=1 Tax=Cephalotus follicularis TaxID=3775 RepID=A0A1Q3BR20_CEPFO|nr:hypothetical protein CFOL_v3_13985 [Cephalotus follicularis]